MTARPVTLSPVVPTRPVRRFSLAEYHWLIDQGVLRPGDPYELLNGVIVYKMPQNSPHATAATALEKRLWRMLPDEWLVRTQKPITIPTSDSEPEPNFAVVAGPEGRYSCSHPTPKEVALVIEVSDSSLADDQGDKLRVYAAARIPVYWVVNIPERRVEVYTDPRAGKSPTYRTRTDYAPGQDVPVTLAGRPAGAIRASEVLP